MKIMSFIASINITFYILPCFLLWFISGLLVYVLCMPMFFHSFDQEGHYLFTGASDSHLYVLDAKPSKRFSVIGYTGGYFLGCI